MSVLVILNLTNSPTGLLVDQIWSKGNDYDIAMHEHYATS